MFIVCLYIQIKGIGVIDFESWRPIYRQNSGVLQPYKDLSYKLVQRDHKLWNKKRIEAEVLKDQILTVLYNTTKF